jgi:hypothetical protein
MTSGCARISDDLSALMDGELDAEREQQVRAHLERCASCSAQLAALREVDAALRALPDRPLPEAVEANMQAILHRARIVRSPSRPPPPNPRVPLYIGGGVLGLAAALILLLYLTSSREPVRIAEAPLPLPPTTIERPAAAEPEEIATASDEELAVALELDTLDDLELIEQLELLERLAALEQGDRG